MSLISYVFPFVNIDPSGSNVVSHVFYRVLDNHFKSAVGGIFAQSARHCVCTMRRYVLCKVKVCLGKSWHLTATHAAEGVMIVFMTCYKHLPDAFLSSNMDGQMDAITELFA